MAFLAVQATISTLLIYNGLSADNTSVQGLIDAGVNPLQAAKEAALYTTELGFFTYRTGVFGGIATGLIVSMLHNRLYKTKLPTALAFFSGTRTVPIVALLAGGLIGIFFYFTWPFIGSIFSGFSEFISKTGLFGTFLYRMVNEWLVPFGMHPLVSLPLRWTELGGSMIVDGELVVGNAAIQLAQLASPEPGKLLVRAFMGGVGIINFAIYPAIALAMYKMSLPENKKKVAGLLIPTIVSTTLFGITEPILFTFLFIAPWLYFGVYAPIAGLAEMSAEFFKVSIYQGNLKDWIPFFLRPEKLNMVPYLYLMPLFFVVSYFLFMVLIKKFDVKTPGRELEESTVKLYSKAEYNERAGKKGDGKKEKDADLANGIIHALGGADNIEDVDNCISRLRIVVKDPTLVAEDQVWKNELEALGVIRLNTGIQIVYGAKVAGVAVDVRDILGGY